MDFDLAAEKALSLTLVLDASAWDYLSDVVRADMFGSEQGRAIYEGVREVIRAGKPVTPITVQAAMLEAGRSGSVIPKWDTFKSLGRAEALEVAHRIRTLWEGRVLRTKGAAAVDLAAKDPGAAAEALSGVLMEVQGREEGGAKSMASLVYDWGTELEREARDPNARPVFFETGFKRLDEATGGLARGELSVFAARPGSGKSSFVVALACNLAAAGIPVGLFWLEDDWRDAVRRVLARRLACEAWRLRGKPAPVLSYVTSQPDWMNRADLPIFVDDAHGLKISDIQARMRRMSREHGVKVFVLDHLGEVRLEREERWNDRPDLALGRVAREYRDTAKSLGAVPILVSQMNRRWEQRGTDTIPQLSDLDGSGQVEQAARVVAFVQLFRDETGRATGKGALHLIKATGGNPGSVGLIWNGQQMTWEDEP